MLEACQFHHNGPCALLAVDDTLQPAPADGRLVRRDMARVRYDRHFDPERIPAVRPNVIGRPDVANYRVANGPKAAAFHPWGRLFVATAATSQRTAEEQALAACNADPSRKGADGPCFLYAVGNKVILPRRLTAPRPPATTIGEAISVLVADQNLASNYAAENDNKALAIEPESGRSFRSGGVPTAEVAERTALEGCQISYALPCVLVASNDQLRAPDPLGAERRDMPRVRHAGAYQPDKVPMNWSSAAQDTLRSYGVVQGTQGAGDPADPNDVLCRAGREVGGRGRAQGAGGMQCARRDAVSLHPLCGQQQRHPAATTHRAEPMIRALLAAIVLLSPAQAHAQGAILETLADLKNTQEPPEWRSTLPQRAEVANVPAPREQLATSTCVSWSVTYAAASQAARRNGLGGGVTLSPAYHLQPGLGRSRLPFRHLDLEDARTAARARRAADRGVRLRSGLVRPPADRGRAQARAALSH